VLHVVLHAAAMPGAGKAPLTWLYQPCASACARGIMLGGRHATASRAFSWIDPRAGVTAEAVRVTPHLLWEQAQLAAHVTNAALCTCTKQQLFPSSPAGGPVCVGGERGGWKWRPGPPHV